MIVPAQAMSLPIEAIGELDPEAYVGVIVEDDVATLEARLAIDGLLTPIWVRRNGNAAGKRWSVIAGRHRLRAAIALKWTEIAAVEMADSTSTTADLRRLQIAENLDRRDLRPIECARFVMNRWCEAAREIAPAATTNQQGEAIRARWSVLAPNANTPEGSRGAVDQATAKACGKKERWVRTYRHIYERIVVDLAQLHEQLNAHQLGASLDEMKVLARVPTQSAREVAAQLLIDDPACESVKALLIAAGLYDSNGKKFDPRQPDATFMTAFGRMKGVRRRVALVSIATELTPSEVLDMVEIFKKRRIISDVIRTS